MNDERVKLLAEALRESDLIRRYDEYSRDAHPETMRRTPLDELARTWAAALLATPAFARLLELDEDEYECGECGHDESVHVHYCAASVDVGSCPCNAEYRRLAAHKEEARP